MYHHKGVLQYALTVSCTIVGYIAIRSYGFLYYRKGILRYAPTVSYTIVRAYCNTPLRFPIPS
ncbi:hypothetical protein [Capnocytophaga canis]|uniref:hypothetical protein n=1 Tax=Capnocytophaga canis TaxID=1848903 RepID=UPI001561EC28|nr:hypothetical protein [Capnocytophaga canis]